MSKTQSVEQQALQAMHDTYNAFIGEGGIQEQQDRLNTQIENTSQYIMSLAGRCKTHSEFKRVCNSAELEFKELKAITNMKESFPLWVQLKSNIVSAMKLGLNPEGFDSEGTLRQAAKEIRKEQREAEVEETESTEDVGLDKTRPWLLDLERINELCAMIVDEYGEDSATLATALQAINDAETAISLLLDETPVELSEVEEA